MSGSDYSGFTVWELKKLRRLCARQNRKWTKGGYHVSAAAFMETASEVTAELARRAGGE